MTPASYLLQYSPAGPLRQGSIEAITASPLAQLGIERSRESVPSGLCDGELDHLSKLECFILLTGRGTEN